MAKYDQFDTSESPFSERAGRGSDDEYCSTAPLDGHHMVSHSVQAPPISWVEACSLCGHISSKALRAQLGEEGHVIELGAEGFTIMHPMTCRPNLFECPMNHVARQAEDLAEREGRYRCRLDGEGRLVLADKVSD